MKSIRKELEAILASSKDGLLTAEAVVQYAIANPDSALYAKMARYGCWNARRAQKKYCLIVAARIIRAIKMQIELGNDPEVVRTIRNYVSLPQDRQRERGGYRSTEQVLSVPELRRNLLTQALAELETFRRKYQCLKELAALFEELDRLAG